jgi:hypothetical protein
MVCGTASDREATVDGDDRTGHRVGVGPRQPCEQRRHLVRLDQLLQLLQRLLVSVIVRQAYETAGAAQESRALSGRHNARATVIPAWWPKCGDSVPDVGTESPTFGSWRVLELSAL